MDSERGFLWAVMLTVSTVLSGGEAVEVFDMDEMRGASTLNASVIRDWHIVEGDPTPRQELIEITVTLHDATGVLFEERSALPTNLVSASLSHLVESHGTSPSHHVVPEYL